MELQRISKSYQTKDQVYHALKNINLSIPTGQLIAIIGPNGAGKSTLLNIMSHLDIPDEGEVLINQIPLTHMKLKDIAQYIAILKQNQTHHLQVSVYDFVAFGRFPYSQGRLTKEDQRVITEVLTYLNLTDLSLRLLPTLSGGQLQRVMIARIMAQDTPYIFLDEPLNNLDIKQAIHLMTILKQLCRQFNKTIVTIMHDINMVGQFADYVIAVKSGAIHAHGTNNQVLCSEILSALYQMNVDCIPYKKFPIIIFNEEE